MMGWKHERIFRQAGGEGAPATETATEAPAGQAAEQVGSEAPAVKTGGSLFEPKEDVAPAEEGGNGETPPVEGAPDWLLQKYAVVGEDGKLDVAASLEKQAQGYKELYGAFSKKTETLKAELAEELKQNLASELGVPEDPKDYAYPEGIEPPQREVDETLRQWAKENNVGAEAFQKLVSDVWMKTMPDPAKEIQALGERARERIDAVNSWVTANVDKKYYGAVERLMQTADGVELLETLMDRKAPAGFAPPADTAVTSAPLTREAIRQLQADPRFGQDEAYTQMVRDKWKAFVNSQRK